MAAGVAGGGIAGNALGKGIVESVYGAFGDAEIPVDIDFAAAGGPTIIDMDDVVVDEGA